MAEFAIALVSLSLAAPELLPTFQKCGKYIADRIRTFKDAPAVLAKLQAVANDLHQGILKADIEIAQQAFSSDEYDTTLKTSLDRHVQALAVEVAKTCKLVEGLSVENALQKIWFSAFEERKARQINKRLAQSQSNLLGVVQILLAQRHLTSDKLRLDERRLVTLGDNITVLNLPGTLSVSNTDFKRSMNDPDISNINVLFEHLDSPEITEDHIRTVAAHLTRHFNREAQCRGILTCLGYRMTPKIELCFQLPEGNFEITSVYDIINGDAALNGPTQRRLDHRFVLARAVAEAVLSVAATDFVHKNIRSNTIFLMQQKDSARNGVLGQPFLTTWQFLRHASTLSKRVNSGSDWCENMYRHPKRYGIHPQERYNIGHDIYSLGVCLLEIGCWTTLSLTVNGVSQPSQTFINAAAEHFSIDIDGADLISRFQTPEEIQKVLIGIAQRELPGRVGSAYAELVQKCLECLEGGFGEVIDFRELSSIDASLFFNDEILATFPSITIG